MSEPPDLLLSFRPRLRYDHLRNIRLLAAPELSKVDELMEGARVREASVYPGPRSVLLDRA